MQILSCSGTLGTCCSDHGLVIIIDTARKVMGLIQLVVPIILIVWATIELMQLVMNPEEKKGIKKLINKFIAAAIVFFVPVFINFTMGLVSSDFSVKACWDQAKSKAELARQTSKYISPYDDQKTTSILPKPDEYDLGVPQASTGTTGGADTTVSGTPTERAVVAYAKQFIGKPYKLGGKWDGSPNYTPTDCVGFVRGVYKHFGIDVPSNDDSKLLNKKYFLDVTNAPHHPGDIVMYHGHWAMMTGNGNEIVHAMSRKLGIRTSKDYRKSSKPLWKIFRSTAVSR